MKKAIKTRWLKALRSGKYKQGKYLLQTCTGEFCCLGVLTDLYKKSKKEKWSTADKSSSYPTKEVVDWAGLDYKNPEVVIAGEIQTLSILNDSVGKSFKQIANIIEKHL